MKKLIVATGIAGAFLLSACSSPAPEAAPVAAPAPVVVTVPTPTPAPEPEDKMFWDNGAEEVAAEEVEVTRVIDGDTIVTDAGTIRIIGFDTPEKGECGFDEATTELEDSLEGKTVYLLTDPIDTENTDVHNRLLRHVVTKNGYYYTSVGEHMITGGFAKPRYNSTDGYGLHGLETTYANDAENAYPGPECDQPKPKPKAEPKPKAAPKSDAEEVDKPNARPGQFCAAADADKYTDSKYGRLQCKESKGGRYRWAHA